MRPAIPYGIQHALDPVGEWPGAATNFQHVLESVGVWVRRLRPHSAGVLVGIAPPAPTVTRMGAAPAVLVND